MVKNDSDEMNSAWPSSLWAEHWAGDSCACEGGDN